MIIDKSELGTAVASTGRRLDEQATEAVEIGAVAIASMAVAAALCIVAIPLAGAVILKDIIQRS